MTMWRSFCLNPSTNERLDLSSAEIVSTVDDKFTFPTLSALKHNELNNVDPQAVFEYDCSNNYASNKKCSIHVEDFQKSVYLRAQGAPRSRIVDLVMQTVAENQTLFCAEQVGGYVLRDAEEGKTVAYVKNKSVIPSDATRFGVVDIAETRKALLRAHDKNKRSDDAPLYVIALGFALAIVAMATP